MFPFGEMERANVDFNQQIKQIGSTGD